ncbi:extracellular solute-binding protein [Candidatus Pelagibacter sp.]|jgi:putative spermidine/putrescine transport system substrate-binding protein|nr:extracellular solute-binding protein [Candidatus Pelagibacter sp.]MDC3000376.1 extracellular solute-binding protein [Candidatus Pelagibacter sp.]MDC3003987.1 extracellular solute-binding protein [Candidatus Pelagibacter sp.]
MKKLSKLLLALSFALSITSSAFAVTVASWGGAYTESQKLGYGDPTAKALGVDINWVDYSGGLSEIKAQKEAGAITWDIIDVFAFDTINGCDEGIFVEFDFDKDFPAAPDGTPASEDFFAPMPSKCAVGNILYSWNYAYNVNNVDGTPSTIKDFFNTKKFPGKRAIYKSALTNLEIALAGDGVYMGKGGSEIYKLLETEAGVNRAMNKIKELCTDPNGGCVFWSAGAQPPELLVSGEVVMATGWNGRFFNAEVGEGAPIKQVWDGQGLDYEYFALVKGGPDEANAKKALAMMTNTEMLAGSAKYIAYAPYRLSSLEIIKANEPWYKDGKTEMMPQMPTAPSNTKKYFLVDPFFWADNGTELGEKWEAMKAGL